MGCGDFGPCGMINPYLASVVYSLFVIIILKMEEDCKSLMRFP